MVVMDRSRNYLGLLSVVGLVVLLVIARGLDAFMLYVRQHMALIRNPPYDFVLWTPALSSLLLASLLLLLFWFVLTRAPRNVWIAALYLLVGVYLAFFRVLYFVPAISGWLPPVLYGLLPSATSYTMLAGSFIAIIGLFTLILPRHEGRIST
jgi:hypothetical protein